MPVSDQAILDHIAAHPGARRKEILRQAVPQASETTVWRALKRLLAQGSVRISGKGPSTGYHLAGAAVVRRHLRMSYERRKPVGYRQEFLDAYIPNKTFYLSEERRRNLREAGTPLRPPLPAGTYARRIVEQLSIDLSWGSSRMEGNTYSLLETERLIRFGREAAGRDRKETIMILNHKEAIRHVVDHLDAISVSRRDLFDIHALLADSLLGDPSLTGRLRKMAVSITHSSYRPLDNPFLIAEEFEIVVQKAAAIADPFEQSFFLMVHIPYLQAFEDVNKRTSRIAANIPLLKNDLVPISFVTMDDQAYVDGLLGVYELNEVSLLGEAYAEAYRTSTERYRMLRAEVDQPEKAAVAYRDFVRDVVRRSVLEWKAFSPEKALELAAKAEIPEPDRQAAVDYAERQFQGLHAGNLIRYRLRPADLEALIAHRDPAGATQGSRG